MKLNLESGNWLRRICIKINNSYKFELFVFAAILLNTCVLAAHHHKISEETKTVLEVLNLFFMFVFVCEATIKIIALRKAYFKDVWNKFDFVIIVLAVLFLVPKSFGYLQEYQGLSMVIRILRVSRMLRIVK